MQVITTKYLGSTNHRQARIKATSTGGISATVNYQWKGSTFDEHKRAAEALCRKLDWEGSFVAGSNGKGYTFVDINDERMTVSKIA